MIVNIHMDMVDRVCTYPFEAKFSFEYDNEDIFRRGIECLNGTYPDKDDALTEHGWKMYRRLLAAANAHLIQTLPRTAHNEVCEIVDDMLAYDYDEEYFYDSQHDDFKQILKQLHHYQGVFKRTKYNSAKYWEYTNKIADTYSQILQHDYDNCDDILFDCEEAFVIEWEEEKARNGESVPTDLDKVKKMTKRYIRCFDMTPQDQFGTLLHPVATSLMTHNPENPSLGFPKPQTVIDAWLTTNKPFFNLGIASEREEWYAIIDKHIDAADSLEDIYTSIIRSNWLDSWKEFIKGYLSFTDRNTISKIYNDYIERINQERDRLFPRTNAA